MDLYSYRRRLGLVGVSPTVSPGGIPENPVSSKPYRRDRRGTQSSVSLIPQTGFMPIGPINRTPFGQSAADRVVPCDTDCSEETDPWKTFTERITVRCTWNPLDTACYLDVTVSTRTTCDDLCELHIHSWNQPEQSLCHFCPTTTRGGTRITPEGAFAEIVKHSVRRFMSGENKCRPGEFRECTKSIRISAGGCFRFIDGSRTSVPRTIASTDIFQSELPTLPGINLRGWYTCEDTICCVSEYEVCAHEDGAGNVTYTATKTASNLPQNTCDRLEGDCKNFCDAFPDKVTSDIYSVGP